MVDNFNAEFLSLAFNEEFINSIKGSDNPEKYLEDLIRKYPEKKRSILSAYEFVRINLLDEKKMDAGDFDTILKNVRNYSENRKQQISHRKISMSYFWKAAVILIVVSFSSYFIYQYTSKKDIYKEIAENRVSGSDKAIIVLSDGSKRVLENNGSFIEYDSDQEKVIIQNAGREADTIQNELENRTPSLNKIVVPFGQRHTLLLSDGTTVYLNSGSNLVFPATFSGRKREVYLKGEAFFEVSENKKVPFIVKTDFIDIKVLGTTFNISADEGANIITAVLVEGKINISQKHKALVNEELVLKPGQGCFYSVDEQKSEVKTVDVCDYISWKDGLFRFKDMSLQEVVRHVTKFFNKPVQVEGERLANTLISGKLVLSDDINEVMEYLSETMEGRYEINENGIYVIKQ